MNVTIAQAEADPIHSRTEGDAGSPFRRICELNPEALRRVPSFGAVAAAVA